MKKEQKQDILQLRQELEPLAEQLQTPETLSAQGITELLEEKHARQKKGKVIALNTVRALAAVLAVVIGVTSAVRLYDRPRVRSIPKAIASAESPLSGTTEKEITDYFTALRAQYDKENSNPFRYGKSADYAYSNERFAEDAEGIAEVAAEAATGSASTNTQVANVDEQDKIENDGRYLYYVTNDQAVRIVDTQTMQQVSLVEPSDDGMTNTEIFYKDNRLVVLSTCYDRSSQTTVIRVFDVTDRAAPGLLKTVEQDGVLFDSRLTGDRLIVLSNDAVELYGLETKGGYADYEDVVPGTKIDDGETKPLDAACITIMPGSESNRYLVITTLDLDSLAGGGPNTFAILGAGDTVYCTEKQLFVASVAYDDSGRDGVMFWVSNAKTNIYEFSFMGATVALEHTGSVPGTLNNSFSLDSADGTLRVATTGTDDKGKTVNRITVLDENLKEIGRIDGIAPGETIRAVRYIGRYGYVVTFERTDPLFVIDFADKTNPKIVAELKLPGFSGYLHPFNGYLVGVGTDGDENGATDGMKISLFDISDPTAPREIDKLVIPRAESVVAYDHHGFLDNSTQNRFGLAYESHNDYYERRFCTVSVENGKLKLLATFTNHKSGDEENSYRTYQPDGSYITAYDPEEGIDRGTFIGDTLYTASPERICAWPFDGGDCLGTVELEGGATWNESYISR